MFSTIFVVLHSDPRKLFPGRSAVIVAAYLMYTNRIDAEAALSIIQKARPVTQLVFIRFQVLSFLLNCFGLDQTKGSCPS